MDRVQHLMPRFGCRAVLVQVGRKVVQADIRFLNFRTMATNAMRREDGEDIAFEPDAVSVFINVHAWGGLADHAKHNEGPQEG